MELERGPCFGWRDLTVSYCSCDVIDALAVTSHNQSQWWVLVTWFFSIWFVTHHKRSGKLTCWDSVRACPWCCCCCCCVYDLCQYETWSCPNILALTLLPSFIWAQLELQGTAAGSIARTICSLSWPLAWHYEGYEKELHEAACTRLTIHPTSLNLPDVARVFRRYNLILRFLSVPLLTGWPQNFPLSSFQLHVKM